MKYSIKRFAVKTFVVIASLAMLAAMVISWDGFHDKVVHADLAIVLGNAVNSDGKPSPRLQGRLDAALKLYQSGYCKTILVSGGIGKNGFDEAEVMKNYLVSHGIPVDHIYTDNKGVNTFETARNAAQLMRSQHMDSAIMVSQFFHIARIRLALKKFGIDAAGNIHSTYFEMRDIYSTFREVAAYVVSSFKNPDCVLQSVYEIQLWGIILMPQQC
jgi:vancomycin permeability regulator SanA